MGVLGRESPVDFAERDDATEREDLAIVWSRGAGEISASKFCVKSLSNCDGTKLLRFQARKVSLHDAVPHPPPSTACEVPT